MPKSNALFTTHCFSAASAKPLVISSIVLLAACAYDTPESLNRVAEENSNLVCEDIAVTGTRFKKRVCRSAEDWETASNTSHEAADEYGRQSRENSAVVQSPRDGQGPFGAPAL